MATLAEIAGYLDVLLRTAEIPDYPSALNGVQVETGAEIHQIAAAVDVRERTIEAARAAGANLMLVHHGLFWGGLQPLRGPFYRRMRSLIRGEIGVYSSHLPLDAHPEFGNNVLLARELGLEPTLGFARFESIEIGVAGESGVATEELVHRVSEFARPYGSAVRCAGLSGARMTRRWAICTGAGASVETLREARERDIDTLIVGEGPHWSAIDAEEQGLAIIYAGHYATEVLGVRAIAAQVAEHFGVAWSFLDAPTGL